MHTLVCRCLNYLTYQYSISDQLYISTKILVPPLSTSSTKSYVSTSAKAQIMTFAVSKCNKELRLNKSHQSATISFVVNNCNKDLFFNKCQSASMSFALNKCNQVLCSTSTTVQLCPFLSISSTKFDTISKCASMTAFYAVSFLNESANQKCLTQTFFGCLQRSIHKLKVHKGNQMWHY